MDTRQTTRSTDSTDQRLSKLEEILMSMQQHNDEMFSHLKELLTARPTPPPIDVRVFQPKSLDHALHQTKIMEDRIADASMAHFYSAPPNPAYHSTPQRPPPPFTPPYSPPPRLQPLRLTSPPNPSPQLQLPPPPPPPEPSQTFSQTTSSPAFPQPYRPPVPPNYQISRNEIKMKEDELVPNKNQSTNSNKMLGLDSILNIVIRKRDAPLETSDDPVKHMQEQFKSIYYAAADVVILRFMVEVCWAPMLVAFSVPLDQSDDEAIISLCLEGFRHAIHITAVTYMKTQRDAFVTSLAKFIAHHEYG